MADSAPYPEGPGVDWSLVTPLPSQTQRMSLPAGKKERDRSAHVRRRARGWTGGLTDDLHELAGVDVADLDEVPREEQEVGRVERDRLWRRLPVDRPEVASGLHSRERGTFGQT